MTTTLFKIGTETDKLLETVTALEEALKNQPNVTDELQDAFDEHKAQIAAVDDKVPDIEPPPPEP